MARISSSDDLYVDLTSPNPSTSRSKNYTVPDEIWLADEEENTMPFLEEEKLKKAEMNLYAELLESDIDKRKEKTQVTSDYEDLQKQVSHLKALIAEKDAKLSALTQQDANVRKNICSLYKTARAEIDHKDSLLTEANSRLDSILYRRNLTIDQLEKQTPHTSSEKSKSNEDKSAGRENPTKSNTESCVRQSHSDGNKKNVDQSSIKRKRSRSPPSDNKNAKIEKNSFLDKRQNCDSKNVCNTAQPVKKGFDTNWGTNPTKLIETEKSNINKSINSKAGQKSTDLASTEHTNEKQNCNLNSAHNNPASAKDKEPSIAEVFSKMQELAFKDPAATNAIFFNLLPGELRQSFLEFEQTQMNALNKLKQSFVSCYFMQCSASTSDPPIPEETSGGNAESQNSSVFFFQQNSSHSKTENDNGLSASNNHSDSVSMSQGPISEGNKVKTESDVQKSDKKPVVKHKPKKEDVLPLYNNLSDSVCSKRQVTVSEGNEVKTESDVQKSAKKPVSRHKTKKEDVPLIHTYRDESLTLYTQRHIRRQQN